MSAVACFALFVDLENCGGKKSMLMDVIERVKIRGDILIGKVYGYTDSYSDLKETLLSNTFAVVPSLRAIRRTAWISSWSLMRSTSPIPIR